MQARRRASSGVRPEAIYPAICCSRWNWSSESRRLSVNDFCQRRRSQRMGSLLLRSAEDQRDGVRETLPVQHFSLKLFAALASEGVKLRFPAGGRVFPLRLEPALLLETVEGGIEGPLGDLEEIPGNLLNTLGDGVAVNRTSGDNLEDEHVESSLEELHFFLGHRRHLAVLPIRRRSGNVKGGREAPIRR